MTMRLCEWFLMLLLPLFFRRNAAIDEDDNNHDDDRRQIGIHYDSSIMEFFQLSQQKKCFMQQHFIWIYLDIKSMWHYTIAVIVMCVCMHVLYAMLNNHFIFHHKNRRIDAICAAKRPKRLTIQQSTHRQELNDLLCACVMRRNLFGMTNNRHGT